MSVKMESVDSNNVAAIGYDPATQTLTVQFHSGSTYDYEGVPPHRHRSLMNAPSKTTFLNAEIKPHHKFTKRAADLPHAVTRKP